MALGSTPEAVAALPHCKRLPSVDTLPGLLGCLCVSEGASLGGQVITRHLRASLGLTPSTGGAFFFGVGEPTGQCWKTFVQALTRLVAEQGGGDASTTCPHPSTVEDSKRNLERQQPDG